MAAAKEIVRSFGHNIEQKNVRHVYKKLQNIMGNYPGKEDSITMNCLISANLLAHRCLEQNDICKNLAYDLYLLADLCCGFLSVKLSKKNADFIVCTYNIIKYLMANDQLEHAIEIGEHVINFLNRTPCDLTEREKCSLKGILSVYSKYYDKPLILTKCENVITDYWHQMFELNSYIGFDVTSKLLDLLGVFTQKVSNTDVKSGLKCFLAIVKKFVDVWKRNRSSTCKETVDLTLHWFLRLVRSLCSNYGASLSETENYMLLLTCIENFDVSVYEHRRKCLEFCKQYLKVTRYSQKSHEEKGKPLRDSVQQCFKSIIVFYSSNVCYAGTICSCMLPLLDTCTNTSKSLYFDGLYKEAAKLSSICLDSIRSLPSDLKKKDPHIETYAEKLVMCACESYRKLQNYKDAFITIARWVVLIPKSVPSLIKEYGVLKSKLNSTDKYTEKTLKDIMEENQEIVYQVTLDELDFILLKELEIYVHIRLNSAVPVMRIFHTLTENSSFSSNQAVIVLYYAGLFVTSDELYIDHLSPVLSRVESTIKVLERKYKKYVADETQAVTACLLANLYFVKFRAEMLIYRKKAENEVIRLSAIIPEQQTEKGMERNSDVEIIPVHKHLQYDVYLKIIPYLDKAIEYWSKATNSSQIFEEFTTSSVVKADMVIEHLKETALIYKLHLHQEKEIFTWKLLQEFGFSLSKNDVIILASSNLLCSHHCAEAETAIEDALRSDCVPDYLKHRYKLENLRRLLCTGNVDSAMSLLSAMDDVRRGKCDYLVAKYHYLKSICEYMSDKDEKCDPLLNAIHAFCIASYVVKERAWSDLSECYEILCLLLDVTLYIGHRFSDAMLPRHSKCYLKSQLELAQKLCIPLRTSQFIAALSWLDLMACNFDDCNFKLESLETIIQPKLLKQRLKSYELPDSKLQLMKPSLVDNLKFRCAPNCMQSPSRFGSPALEEKVKFQLPEFVTHDEDCCCHYCGNFEYQFLILQMTLLKSVKYHLKQEPQLAIDYFNGTASLISIIKEETMGSNVFNRNIIIAEWTTHFSMCLADFYASIEMFKDATEQNVKALNSYTECSSNYLLYQQLMEQKFAIERAEELSKEKQAKKEVRKITTAKKSKATPLFKTPEVPKSIKKSQPLSEVLNTAFVTPRPRRGRRLLFEGDEFEMFKTPNSRKVKSKKENLPKITEL